MQRIEGEATPAGRAAERSAERHAFLLKLSDALRAESETAAIERLVVRLLADELRVDRCFLSHLSRKESVARVGPEYCAPGFAPIAGVYRYEDFPDSIRRVEIESLFVPDVAHEPGLSEVDKSSILGMHIAALLTAPLRRRDRDAISALTVGSATPRAWTREELHLVEAVAERTWTAVERAGAEQALRASEAKYRAIFDSMNEGFSLLDIQFDDDGRAVDVIVRDANPAQDRIDGVRALLGQRVRDIVPHIEQTWIDRYAEVARSGASMQFEDWSEANQRWYMVNASRVGGPGSTLVAIVYDDITERRRAEATLRASELLQTYLVRLGDTLRSISDAHEIQRAAMRLVGEQLGADRALYADFEPDGREYTIADSYARPGVPERVGRFSASGFPSVIARFVRGETPVIADVRSTSLLSEAEKATAIADGILAVVGVPLLKDGRLVAHLGVQMTRPREWTADEIHIVRETADRTWAAVERARAEAALGETQRRLEGALATARMAYWDWNPATDTTVASASMVELYGLLPGGHFRSRAQELVLVHPDDREQHRTLVEAARARGEGWHTEFRIVRPRDGRVVWVEERATPTRDPVSGARHTMGLVWDITDRRRAEAAAELERRTRERDVLRRELAAAEEAERRRLARELHDELGQELTAFRLGLDDALRLAGASVAGEGAARLIARLGQLQTLATRVTTGARAIALELRPPELDDVGLESALESYVAEWSARYGIQAEVAVTGLAAELPMPPEVASALYRIAQEALTNVAKHAGASQASVIVEHPEGEVRLIIEDDGGGFDVPSTGERARAERRLGLSGMRERAGLVGGTLEIESSPGAGTSIYVRLPLGRA